MSNYSHVILHFKVAGPATCWQYQVSYYYFESAFIYCYMYYQYQGLTI